MTDKPRYQIRATPEGQTIRGLGSKISERFEREFAETFEGLGLKTPDGEPLHVDDESITDLLKRTGGQ